jgi:glyoxylase-like metal-dependent hydrolase (beta-lactamase superfamily II)
LACAVLALLPLGGGAVAAEPLLTAQPVADGVHALVGPTAGRNYENHGLNANFGVVVTDAGVVLIDAGASAAGAQLIEAAVRRISDRPIRYVINTGSQDHRWLGNGWFAARGAQVIAHARTVATQRRFAEQHLAGLAPVLKERLDGTRPLFAAAPVEGDVQAMTLGGVPFEIRWAGDAHFPGDVMVWLPQQRVLFSGDVVYTDRMLGVLPASDVVGWRKAYAALEALAPATVVPGHGRPVDLAGARRDTGDYLDFLVDKVGAALESWEPLDEVVARLGDAPAFTHLRHYDSWHRTNVNRTYLQLEAR